MAKWGILTGILVTIALLSIADGARKINARHAMEHARRSRDLSNLMSRDKRDELMGLGAGEELKPGQEVKTATGTTKVKFVETYQGLPIEGASVVFEEDSEGGVTNDVTGHLVSNLDDDLPSVKPRLSAEEVFRMVARKNQDDPDKAKFNPKEDATLEIVLDDSLSDAANARLAYKLSYRVEEKGHISRPFFMVDANTGDIIRKWEGLSLRKTAQKFRRANRVQSNYELEAVGGNKKIGKAEYNGKHYPKLEITKNENGSCSLENNVAIVSNCDNSWDCYREAENAFNFSCSDGFTDAVNGAYSPMADALFYISMTFEMFDEWFGIKNPLQRSADSASVCHARIHFGEAYENAFWDGYYITFGDGNNTFYPLTSMNVVAHEIAHGVTEMNSGLIYQGESGGMNEAFSDMAGEAVEYYANKKSDWMVGYEAFKHPDKALRYFEEPEKDGMSIGNYNHFCPYLDPHFSSGVFNRAFYYLGVTEGWDVKSAFSPFVAANVLYWTPNSRMFEAACGVVQAAKDFKLNFTEVIEAFRKVGIEPCENTGAGILQTVEITVPEGHEVVVQFEVTKDMNVDHLTISVNGGRMSVNVHTPGCEICSDKNSYQSEIEICDVHTGTYEITAKAMQEIVKGTILIEGPSLSVVANETLPNENSTVEFQFEIAQSFLDDYPQAIFAMNSEYGYGGAIFKHEKKPDLENYDFDFYVTVGDKSIVCALKVGTYHGIMKPFSGSVRGIYIDAIGLIEGKRLDKAPKETRAPRMTTPVPTTLPPLPSTPDTGSAGGSGDSESGDDTYYL